MRLPRAPSSLLALALLVLVVAACPAGAEPVREASPSASRASAAGPPGAEGCPVFPADSIWHSDVSGLPVHAKSAAWTASMGGATKRLHPDFGDSGEPMPYGIPWNTVPGSHPKTTVDFYYPDESDPGPYPFDQNTPIEGGSDRHALTIDRDNCVLYELYDAEYAPGGGSTAGSGAIFDLRSNALRPAGWTSADAAGLPVFAGLVRQDEVAAGVIDHAIRVTASRTDRSYVWPARHQAGAANDPNLPPMGARFRLKASFDVSGYREDTKVFLAAFKKHGMILADNGSDWFFTGAAEPGWNGDLLDELKSIPASAFEAVDASSLMIDPDSGQAKPTGTTPPPPPPPPPPGVAVTVKDFAFAPKTVSLPRGQTVTWTFTGPTAHTVTDNSGMGIYDSGPRTPGATFSLMLGAAGGFKYRCTIHTGMTGTIRVPLSASPASGSTSTSFTVTWAVAPPPAGLVYDVQIKKPGAKRFTSFRFATTTISTAYVPNAGTGTYRFRARVRQTATGKATNWSINVPITVA